MIRKFEIRDVKTDELIYSGVGTNAQEVYEDWRRMDLRPIEYPLPGDLESEDPQIRLQALLLLNSNEDSWIDDPEIRIKFIGKVTGARVCRS